LLTLVGEVVDFARWRGFRSPLTSLSMPKPRPTLGERWQCSCCCI